MSELLIKKNIEVVEKWHLKMIEVLMRDKILLKFFDVRTDSAQ